MKKTILVCLLFTVAAGVMPVCSETLQDVYFPPAEDGVLSERERKALNMIRDWKDGKTTGVKPIPSGDGSVRFVFGTSLPIISCAALQITDIELEPGEVVFSINAGDTARWGLTPAVTGTGDNEIQHIIVKPIQPKLNTSLVVTTDRRTYHMTLKSYINTYMPKVSFIYPENLMAKWERESNRKQIKVNKLKMDGTNQRIDELDFEYNISGNGKWKPTRVYNDGIRTIIHMPKEMLNGEAPSLLVWRKNTGQEVLVNYRVHNARYIVDNVFDKAFLIAGVGNAQEKITITRRTSK